MSNNLFQTALWIDKWIMWIYKCIVYQHFNWNNIFSEIIIFSVQKESFSISSALIFYVRIFNDAWCVQTFTEVFDLSFF